MDVHHFSQFYQLYGFTYNLVTFLVFILSPSTKNEYTVKDKFQFAEEICDEGPILFMGSLDVGSLFTNILLDETIDICINQPFQNTKVVKVFKSAVSKH